MTDGKNLHILSMYVHNENTQIVHVIAEILNGLIKFI